MRKNLFTSRKADSIPSHGEERMRKLAADCQICLGAEA
jgi:hypothetical protein